MTTLSHLECSRCSKTFDSAAIRNLCECGGPLLARYDLAATRLSWSREWLGHAPSTMWRYAPLLPVANPNSIVSLGEGMTPVVRARRLGGMLGLKDLWIKDEGVNPAASVEARGFSCAVSMAVERGVRAVTVSSPPSDGGAFAAYAAAAGIEAAVVLSSEVGFLEPSAYGAKVVFGTPAGAFGEPYYLEGIKTLGLEIAEQFRWDLPAAILAPSEPRASASGSIVAAIEKAFDELEAIGWISSRRPKMIAVQPGSLPDMLEAGLELARTEGIFPAPVGGACLIALRKLLAEQALSPDERIVLVNPAAGLKYAAAYATRLPRPSLTEQDKLGGLITPR